MFGVPKGLYLVGAMLAILGFVTELNTILFVGLGLVFIIVARNIEGTIETAQIEQEVDSEEAAAEEKMSTVCCRWIPSSWNSVTVLFLWRM